MARQQDYVEEIKEALKPVLDQALEAKGFSWMGAGDRHGSVELVWSRRKDDIVRYVVVTLTPAQAVPRRIMEVWVGLDRGRASLREPVDRWQVLNTGEALKRLDTIVPQAIELALRLDPERAEPLRPPL